MGPLANLSVGDLMYGMVFPGLIMAGLYLAYILVLCTVRPGNGPRIPPEPGDPGFGEKVWISVRNLVPPIIMIFAVLGSILLGWASPTEAAAIGALCSVALTMLYRQFTLRGLYDALLKTLTVTAMIMAVLLAGTLFTGVFIGGGGINTASRLIQTMQLDPWALLALMMFILFIAGFFLDWISIVLILVPISFNGLGLQEGAFMLFFNALGVAPTQSFVLAIGPRISLLVFSVIGGIIYRLGIKKLRSGEIARVRMQPMLSRGFSGLALTGRF